MECSFFTLAAGAFGGQFPLTVIEKHLSETQPGKSTVHDTMLRTPPEMREEGVHQAEMEMKHRLPTPKQMLQPLSCWIKNPLPLPLALLFLWIQTSTWKQNTSLTKLTDLPMLNELNNLGFLWKVGPIFKTPYQNQTSLPLQLFSLAAEPVLT